MKTFKDLRTIDVGEHIEKKNNLNYLSWAYAVDQLLQEDSSATWEYKEPRQFGETLMVFCEVNAFGKKMQAQLPVMDHRNKAIASPDSFQVNVAMQRCLAKAIALHGIGLYIYAGEDLPQEISEGLKTVGTASGKPNKNWEEGYLTIKGKKIHLTEMTTEQLEWVISRQELAQYHEKAKELIELRATA